MTVPPPRTRTPAPFPFPTWPKHVFVYTHSFVFILLLRHICVGFYSRRGWHNLLLESESLILPSSYPYYRYQNIHLESTMACKSHRKHFHAKDLGVGVQIARHSLVPHLGRHFKLLIICHSSSFWGSITSNLSSIAWFWFQTHSMISINASIVTSMFFCFLWAQSHLLAFNDNFYGGDLDEFEY